MPKCIVVSVVTAICGFGLGFQQNKSSNVLPPSVASASIELENARMFLYLFEPVMTEGEAARTQSKSRMLSAGAGLATRLLAYSKDSDQVVSSGAVDLLHKFAAAIQKVPGLEKEAFTVPFQEGTYYPFQEVTDFVERRAREAGKAGKAGQG
jgi:hypothetical protein